jgi:hypothetical protein
MSEACWLCGKQPNEHTEEQSRHCANTILFRERNKAKAAALSRAISKEE